SVALLHYQDQGGSIIFTHDVLTRTFVPLTPTMRYSGYWNVGKQQGREHKTKNEQGEEIVDYIEIPEISGLTAFADHNIVKFVGINADSEPPKIAPTHPSFGVPLQREESIIMAHESVPYLTVFEHNGTRSAVWEAGHSMYLTEFEQKLLGTLVLWSTWRIK
ncbi:hypothetical protein ADUPG1_000137, partial [Aduncisulcus paluster]